MKSYVAIYHMMRFPVTLSEPWLGFYGHSTFPNQMSLYFSKVNIS